MLNAYKPKTHPDITLVWPRRVLQRLRTRMGVPRGLIPSATFEDTFTSAASCRRPTRGLQNSQNEYGLPSRPSPSHHAHSILGSGWQGAWFPNVGTPLAPPQTVERGPGKRHGSLRIINEVGFSGGRE